MTATMENGNRGSNLLPHLLKPRKRIIIVAWLVAIVIFLIYQIFTGSSHDKVTDLSILTCAVSTFLFWIFRKPLVSAAAKWNAHPSLKFIIIGSLCAVWVETAFWTMETIFGITGVAASHNLAIDLGITMPWYVMMVALLWKVESTYRYSYFELFLFGGVYEFFTDGLLGGAFGGRLSPSFILLLIFFIPAFMMTYSFIVLPPSFLVRPNVRELREERESPVKRHLFGLLPLIGLIPYAIFLLILLG